MDILDALAQRRAWEKSSPDADILRNIPHSQTAADDAVPRTDQVCPSA